MIVLYRWLLRLLPAGFRRRHEDELLQRMTDAFAQDGARGLGRLRVFAGLIQDVVASAPSVHARERRVAGSRRGSGEGIGRGFLMDVRHGVRVLARQPGFTVVAVATLAFGIGGTTAIFSVVRGVLLRPLPYRDAGRLANIWVDLGVGNQSLPAVSPNDYLDYRARSVAFQEFAAASGGNAVGASGILTGSGDPEQVIVSTVTANFFPLLGVDPMYGRQFVAAEEAPRGGAVVILSEPLWRRRYGADPSLVGRTIDLDGVAHQVVGVMPRPFRLLLPSEAFLVKDSDIWKPLQIDYAVSRPRNLTFFTVFGRLKPDVTFAQAQDDMERIARDLRAEHLEHQSSDMRIRVIPLQDDVVKHARTGLLTIFGAVGLVLLIACANLAHLLLARSAARRRELAVRSAVGASRWRIMRQLVTESGVLALFGGVAGVGVAAFALDALAALAPSTLPRQDAIVIDGAVLMFAAAATAATAIVFGWLPAWRAATVDITPRLKPGTGAAADSGGWRVRDLLIAGEVMLSVVLLVGAGLMIRSFVAMHAIKPGFDADRAISFRLSLPVRSYRNAESRATFVRQLEGSLAATAGVSGVGATSQLPLTGSGPLSPYAYDEQTAQNWESATAEGRSATNGYFAALGTRLISGRFFDDRDRNGGDPVIIVDETLAARAWPGQSAVGQHLQLSPSGTSVRFAEVVGVVEHVRMLDLTRNVRGEIFYPYAQSSARDVAVVVRTTGDPAALAGVVRDVVRRLDPNLPVTRVLPMRELVGAAREDARFTLVLMALFGVFALGLAATGIYGVISYSVNQRTKEIGIRIALGGDPARIRNLVLMEGMRLVLGSLVIGLIVALALGRFVSTLLYGVAPHDLLTLASAATVLAVAALVGCYLPARRATLVDPLIALRAE